MGITANFTSTSSMKSPSSEPVFSTVITPSSRVHQSTQALYLDQTTQDSYLNLTTPAPDFNQTTLTSYLDQNISAYDVSTASIPLTGLTYTLFGLTCCFTVLGLCGNGLILISMFKFRRRSEAHGVLIGSLAICDSVACLSWALTQPCVHDVFGMDIRAIATIWCKISWAILYSAMFSSSAIVVLICIERYLAVWMPHKILSKQNMLRAVWICVTPIVLIYVTMPVLYCEIKDGVCHPNYEGSEKSTVLKGMPNTTIYILSIGITLVISMLILSILTPLTIVKLFKQWVIKRRITTSELNSTHFATSLKLISVVIAHITLIGSQGLVAITFGLSGSIIDENTISALALALLLNHSINFLLYNIFDAEFRRNVLALFGFTSKDN